MDKPFSQSCENNKIPILEVLQRVFDQARLVLEIGSGTGQHAVYFASRLRHLHWQPSDVLAHLPGITQWCQEFPSDNLRQPKVFDICEDPWPIQGFDAVFSANTAHIMHWATTAKMVERVAEKLPTGGMFALYGPFNYGGRYTSESNARFDMWLKQRDAGQGIRNFEDIHTIAQNHGLSLFEDNSMPANNRLLVWVKQIPNQP